jgi:hypothetical protein
MIFGIDYLAGAKYGNEILKSHPSGFAAGFFANTFGDAFPIVSRLAQTGRCPIIRIQLNWDDDHKYTDKHLKIAVQEARRYEKLKTASSIELSFATEHLLDNPDKWGDIIKGEAPSCTVVNNPWYGRGSLSKRYKNEQHSGSPIAGPSNWSFDGLACVDVDIEAYKKRYSPEIFFFWTHQLNLKYNEKDSTPRPLRKVRPSVELLRSLANLANPKGATNFPKTSIWKSHAEQSDWDGDNRSSKPCLITPAKASKIDLVKNGKVVATMAHYGQFVDGRQRYYANKYGYQISQEPLEVRANGKLIGVVNPGFRETFR